MRPWRRMHSRTSGVTSRPRLRPRLAGQGGEEGFTLIELVVVIIILPIVVSGIAAALIAILQNETTTFNRVADSADAQLISANFARDVQSAAFVSTSGSASAPGGQCWPTTAANWPSTPPAGSEPLLGLQWGQTITRTFTDGELTKHGDTLTSPSQADFTPADLYSSVTDTQGYIPANDTVVSVTAGDTTSVGLQPNPASGTTNDDTVTLTLKKTWVASYWSVPVTSGASTTYELVRQFCLTNNGGIGGGGSKYLGSSIVAHDLPANQGSATVTCGPSIPASQCTASSLSSNTNWLSTAGVTSISLSADEPASGYQFNLSASPRNSNLSSQGVSGLLLTGSGTSLTESLDDRLTVNGDLDFNSSSGSGTGDYTSSLAINPIPGQPAIAENQCSNCSAVMSSFPPGTVTCGASAPTSPTCPATAALSGPVSVPTIPPPTSPTASGPAGSCSSGPNPTCTPGYYSSLLVLGGNVTFTSSGNYTFAQGVLFSSGSTVDFGSGQYTFMGGLSAANGVTLNGSGVFFYLPGTSSMIVDDPGDSMQLSAGTTGPYAGVLIDQPSTSSPTLALGGGITTNTLAGLVDSPYAQVSLGSTDDTFTVGSLIASSLTLGTSPGNSSVTVTVGS